ncbi:hypothetical protein SEVIR_2G129200v4 [Setaria viridis]|nr:hypothetical protein SEVIR_2G129200v2 [Setaria viridis]
MATAAAAAETTGSAPEKEVVQKKVELMKEIRAHEVAIAELDNLHPSRAVYQKAGNIFFRKSVKSVVTTEQKQLDLAKARLSKLNQA